MKSKYETFDRVRLLVKPLAERANDLEISRWLALEDPAPQYSHPQLSELAGRIVAAPEPDKKELHMVVFAGHRADEPGRSTARFPASCEAKARDLLFKENHWIADYRRLRIVAHK